MSLHLAKPPGIPQFHLGQEASGNFKTVSSKLVFSPATLHCASGAHGVNSVRLRRACSHPPPAVADTSVTLALFLIISHLCLLVAWQPPSLLTGLSSCTLLLYHPPLVLAFFFLKGGKKIREELN